MLEKKTMTSHTLRSRTKLHQKSISQSLCTMRANLLNKTSKNNRHKMKNLTNDQKTFYKTNTGEVMEIKTMIRLLFNRQQPHHNQHQKILHWKNMWRPFCQRTPRQ
eukprot:PhF_6_TR15914/c0_g1_i1/m.24595